MKKATKKAAKKQVKKLAAKKVTVAAFKKVGKYKINDTVKVVSRITNKLITGVIKQFRNDGSFAYVLGKDGNMYYPSISKLKENN